MKKFFKKVFGVIAFLLGCDCELRRETVDAGICDFSGQGRDKYGH